MAAARRFKPTIPEVGEHGIAIRDELRLVREVALGPCGTRAVCAGFDHGPDHGDLMANRMIKAG
jgi:hypothetical protein